jgi:rhodanese-related sulfurtransferase
MKMARTLKSVDADAAARLMKQGALMVDIRESGEHARNRIPGSHNLALSRFERSELPLRPDQPVVFFCATGNRTRMHAARLADKAGTAEAYVLEGGLSGWSQHGLPIDSGSPGQGNEHPRRGLLARILSR